MTPLHTAPYIAALALLGLFLSLRIISLRRRLRVGIGTGKNPELSQAIRAHANLVEHVPLILLMILCLELSKASPALIHTLGGLLLIGRCLHAWGLSNSAGTSPGRFIGMLLTFLVVLVSAGSLFYFTLSLL